MKGDVFIRVLAHGAVGDANTPLSNCIFITVPIRVWFASTQPLSRNNINKLMLK